MATTFSPPPASRRSVANRLANSPPRRIKVTGASRAASRLATPPVRQADPRLSPNDRISVHSGMDVDENASLLSEAMNIRAGTETLFAKSDQLIVSFYANLPVEVRQILRTADFFKDAYTGDIDTLTGYSLIASVRTCFVWQHAQALKGPPSCYIFSCPQDAERISPPFHALIPYGSSREPGLILLSLDGKLRFWESIGIGLAGGEHYTTAELELSSGEEVTNLARSDAQTYVVSTSAGHLFRLVLASSGGKYQLSIHAFSRSPQKSLFRLLPSLFSGSRSSPAPTSHSHNISAVAFGATTPTGGRYVWAVVDTRLQKWELKPEGWEELLQDSDVFSVLAEAVRTTFVTHADSDEAKMDLELVDLAVDGQDTVILVSYAHAESETSMAVESSVVRRTYALAHLSVQHDTCTVQSLRTIPYQSSFSTGAPMHPRIQPLFHGTLIAVQFGDAVALCARDVNYRDRIELKATSDRTLGIGVGQSDGPLLVLTAGVMMKVSIHVDNILAYDTQHGEAKQVKSILTQAMLFSGLPDNPLQFSFPPDLDEESLMSGAEQLSEAVLESDPELVQKNHDLSAQLAGRKERLSWLIRFINDNAALVKMSQRTRQQLATDAEKLYSSHQLWMQHNELLATNPAYSILHDAVHAYMEEMAEGHHEDVMRTFFRLRVNEIGHLVKKVVGITVQASDVTDRGMVEFLPEANRIVLTIIRSAFEYREYNAGVYGIQPPMIKAWTSRPAVIEAILGLFDGTTKALDSSSGRDSENERTELHSQLPDLAATLFACTQERLDWLGSGLAASEPANERDRDELGNRFDMLRPEVLDALHRHGHSEAAFALAEKYRDFAGLAALCHKEPRPAAEAANSEQIRDYIERFKEDFATELYRWYIQHGELRMMFAQDESHGAYMDKYFHENPNTLASWINDLGKSRYGEAAAALLAEASQATHLEAKHLMLSIGKLSHLAQLHEGETTVDESVPDAFHDELDFVSVHEALVQEFRSALETVRGRQALEGQIDTVVKVKASGLADRKALGQIFRTFVRDLLQGKTLLMEDAVDVLTLKDNVESVEDFVTALQLLSRVRNLPEARKASAFRTVWRRVYLHDDWDTIRRTANISDAELNSRFRSTALYTTLVEILGQDDKPAGLETVPDEALLVPSVAEIGSRWPGLSIEEVGALAEDYNLECDKLGEMDLNDVYPRIRELAVQDVFRENEV